MPVTRSGNLGDWQRLATALTQNEAELPELSGAQGRLETLIAQVQDYLQRQATHAAAKQDASQTLIDLNTECNRQCTVIRFALKQHYGPRSERLVEFGIQPFRGRLRKPGTVPEPPPPQPE